MNVPVFTRPDPVDLGIDQVLRTSTLPTEVRRQITARIGQGFFRDTLLSLLDILPGLNEAVAKRSGGASR
jgi:hypothetical protein